MQQVCENLGFAMTTYLSIEAFLYCKGGAATKGTGPFDMNKLLEWLQKREILISPKKKQEHQ